MIALRTQEFGLAGVRFIIAAAIVGTLDVGPFVAFAFATSGSDVEVADAGPHEQRQQCINQRGFTAAIATDQQCRLAGGRD